MSTPTEVLFGKADFAVVCGDATDVLKSIPSNVAHVCYCDPPYGLSSHGTEDVLACLAAWLEGKVYTHGGRGFMGKEWDAFVPGPEVWREVYRVLKPGAYCVAFSSTRTVDLLGISMRIAGGEMREGWAWIQGQGFPKNHDVSKAIDKQDAAKQWSGYGTTTKPAYEPLVVTRRPLEGTVANNVLTHGCGALNIDAARITTTENLNGGAFPKNKTDRHDGAENWRYKIGGAGEFVQPPGRFPSNLALIHEGGCVRVGTNTVQGNRTDTRPEGDGGRTDKTQYRMRPTETTKRGYSDNDGTETVDEWHCTDTCAVQVLSEQSGDRSSPWHGNQKGNTKGRKGGMRFGGREQKETSKHEFGDLGTAARFYYQGKASPSDRLAYLTCSPDCTANNTVSPIKDINGKVCPVCNSSRTVYQHPTVKPYDLAAYHARLLSLPEHVGAVAIVPFCGTGIEARALFDLGFRVIAIDIDPRHVAMTLYRLTGAQPRLVTGTPPTTTTLDDLLGLT